MSWGSSQNTSEREHVYDENGQEDNEADTVNESSQQEPVKARGGG